MNMEAIIAALLIPFAGTALGSAFVFFMKKDIPQWLQKTLLGFASGVMVAASVWSLLIPSMEMGGGKVWPAVVGLLGGFAFLLLIDYVTPHIHADGEVEGLRHWRLERYRGAYRRSSGAVAGIVSDAAYAVFAGIRGWGDALCGDRRTGSGNC